VTRRSRSLDLAAEAQRALLPPLTFLHPRLAIAGVLENAYETGGDAFDYAVNDRVAQFGIFDAMGHGLAASLLAATVVTAYRNGRRRGMKLAESFEAIDAMVAAQHGGHQFVTAQLGELDIETGDLTWINGGHPLPFQVRDGSVVGRLRCEPSLPLGLGGPIAEIASERLQPGDRLLFFSDGVIEARARDGELFGEERLAGLLARVSAARIRPAETMRQLVRAVLLHQGSDLKDDASLVLVEWGERA
jgi:serine phosphatase RsbU (regulator of sigma subunit)